MTGRTTPRILVIAGSDSGGGAGIQADIKTITMLGGHAMTAVTAITAQNTLGVHAVHLLPVSMVEAQIEAIYTDFAPEVVKIGMIGSAEIAGAVAEMLRFIRLPIVFDPVMVATSGSTLADAGTVEAFGALARMATVVTPNLPELATLCGLDEIDAGAVEEVAGRYAPTIGSALLVKGGHALGDIVTDRLVYPDGQVVRWENDRIRTDQTHGTGCTLASGIATGLAQGLDLPRSIDRAIRFVRAALAAAPGIGRRQGPMGHALGQIPFDRCLA